MLRCFLLASVSKVPKVGIVPYSCVRTLVEESRWDTALIGVTGLNFPPSIHYPDRITIPFINSGML